MAFQIPPDRRFVETFAIVRDCSPCEQHMLWEKFHDMLGVPWAEENLGAWYELGQIDKRPICVGVSWAIMATKRVVFVHGQSQLVDHKMIEQWTSAVFPNAESSSDGLNFGHVLDDIAKAIKVKSLYRYELELDPLRRGRMTTNFLVPV